MTARRFWIVGGFAALGVLAVFLQHVIIGFDVPFWGLFDNQLDLDVYRAGAQTVFDGGRLYDAKLLGQMDYTYAPVSVVLFTPFAAMSFLAARIVWTIAIFVALYYVIVLSFRVLGRPVTWPLRVIAIALVLVAALTEPVRSTIWFGQVNIFLMAMVLWDLLRPEGARLRGVATGIAAGIKLTPLIFVVYLAAQRSRRSVMGAFAGFAGTVAVAFVVLPRDSLQYWTGTFFDSDRVGVPNTVGNQSIRGALANYSHTDHPSAVAWLVLAAGAICLGLGAALLAHRRGQELLALTLVGMTSCAVSPMSWGHHWVWIVPLGVILVHHALDARTVATGIAATVAASALLLTTFAWRTVIDGPMTFVGDTHPDARYTGLFFKAGIGWLRWFTLDPYNWVFVVAAVVTIVLLWRPTTPTSPESDPGRRDRRSPEARRARNSASDVR